MELRQLRYFIAVAEYLSYSRAAEKLHISISPLSRHIYQLEDEFGVRLFVRDRRRVELTDAGKLFLEDAKALIGQAERVSEHLRQVKDGAAGIVRVGVGLHLGERVGSMVAEHVKRFPGVEIECKYIYSARQNDALKHREIDIGFLRDPVNSTLASEVLYEERLMVVVSKSNPLSKRRFLRVKDLAHETVFVPEAKIVSGLRQRILDLFAKAGVSPRMGPPLREPPYPGEAHRILLAANKGIFILGDGLAARGDISAAAVAVPLGDPDAKIEVHVAWRKKESSPAVLSVLDTARRVLRVASASRV